MALAGQKAGLASRARAEGIKGRCILCSSVSRSMAYDVNALKLDFTSIQKSDSHQLVLLNFNYPIIVVQNIPVFERFLNVAADYLQTYFGTLATTVRFQVTASYYLRHKELGKEKVWTGSFHPKGNGPAVISCDDEYHLFPKTILQTLSFTLAPKITRKTNSLGEATTRSGNL